MKEKISRHGIPNVKKGMIWYEDDTFSFERMTNKKIKAVVELINDGFVFGDLTVSELINVEEKHLNWEKILIELRYLSREFKERQFITWQDGDELLNVCNGYDVVRKTFVMLGKSPRNGVYWTSRVSSSVLRTGILLDFNSAKLIEDNIENSYLFRPVLKFKFGDDSNGSLNAELWEVMSSIFST